VIILLCCFEKSDFPLATGDKETAMRIFAGVGFEGLSAIFAIVISLSLMAVQLASQQYTHRIMDIHTKSWIFRFVIVIYLGSMLYNVFMLGWLDFGNSSVDSKYVKTSMSLTCLSLFILIPYFYITMRRLKPESVISNLLAKIDDVYLNSVKGYIKEGELRIPSEADEMLPITDIIEKSIRSGDHETARFGIDEICRCYMSHVKKENEDYVSRYFLAKHIRGIGREAIIKKDDDSMVQVLKIFGEVGTRAIHENLNYSARMSVESIDIIGSNVLKDYDVATEQMIKSLQDILGAVIKSGNGEEILKQIFTLYSNLSDELFNLEKNKLIKYLLNSFSEPRVFMKKPQALIEEMVKNTRYETIDSTVKLLERISVNAANRGLRDPLDQSISSLHEIGISSAENKLVWGTPKRKINIAKDLIIEHLLTIEDEISKCKLKFEESDFDDIMGEIDFAKIEIESYF
jgi:hypothetical protein